MIPKTIFYVWFGEKKIPEKYVKYIDEWRKLNPDFQIIQINEKNFDIKKYKFIDTAIKNKKWAFASDMARLITIYDNGGFYLDTDVRLLKHIPSFKGIKSVWALENSDAINTGSFFGAEKGNQDLGNIIDIYKKMVYEPGNDNKYITVHIISNYFHKKGFKFKNRKQILNSKALVLPVEYFSPLHWWGGGKVSRKTIGVHMYGASWQPSLKVTTKERVKLNLILKVPFITLGLIKLKQTLFDKGN